MKNFDIKKSKKQKNEYSILRECRYIIISAYIKRLQYFDIINKSHIKISCFGFLDIENIHDYEKVPITSKNHL